MGDCPGLLYSGVLGADNSGSVKFPADSKRTDWASAHCAPVTSSGRRPYRESTDFSELRSRYEAYLVEGRRVRFTLRQAADKAEYQLEVR